MNYDLGRSPYYIYISSLVFSCFSCFCHTSLVVFQVLQSGSSTSCCKLFMISFVNPRFAEDCPEGIHNHVESQQLLLLFHLTEDKDCDSHFDDPSMLTATTRPAAHKPGGARSSLLGHGPELLAAGVAVGDAGAVVGSWSGQMPGLIVAVWLGGSSRSQRTVPHKEGWKIPSMCKTCERLLPANLACEG